MKKKFKKKNLNVLSVNTFALVLSIIFLTVGSNFQSKSFFRGTFINEVFIILIPALIISGSGRRKEVLKVRKMRKKDFLRVILVVILSYPIILLLNGIFLSFLSTFIELKSFSMDILLGKEGFWGYLFFMCIVPAICEEVFFRGALINSYDIYGRKFAIIMSSLVFALFHFDVQNFIAPFLLGILFANLLELTRTIYAPIFAHFLNNLIAMFTSKYLSENLFYYLKQTELAKDIGSLQLYIIIILTFVSILCAVCLRTIFKNMDREKTNWEQENHIRNRVRAVESIDFFNFVPILALIVLYFIYYEVVF